MRTVKGIHSIVEKTTDHLCGRLIFWDVGTPHENFVMLAPAYHNVQYDPSPEIELKPYVFSEKDYEVEAKSIAAINKVLKRLDLSDELPYKASPKKTSLN